MLRPRLALALVALLIACGRREASHRGEGDVVAIDGVRAVTIRHDDIPDLMPAMTMEFAVRSPGVLTGVAIGQRVRFDLVRDGERFVVVHVTPIGGATGGRPMHDHTPHHGGVVAMASTIHVEAAAAPDGRVRLWVTDLWRRPLPLEGAGGEVRLDLPDGPRTLPLAVRGDHLEATGPPLLGRDVRAHVRLLRDGNPTELHFLLPLASDSAGAGNIPATGCEPPEARPGDGRRPHCVVHFPQPVSTVATTPDGALVVVAVVNLGATVWRLPAAELATGFAAPPPTEATGDEPPHGVTTNAIAIGPDGAEAVVGLERRVLRYAVASGRLLGELPSPGGLVRSVAWSPDGTRLLFGASPDSFARLVDSRTGEEIARLPVDGEVGAVAISPDGRLAAVGSELGSIATFALGSDAPLRVIAASTRSADAIAFAGDRLVSASADGALRVWEAGTGKLLARQDVGTPLLRVAIASGARLAATAGLDWKIRLHALETGAVVATLAWHHAGVPALAWAGDLLVSGDTEGWLAVWDVHDVAATI